MEKEIFIGGREKGFEILKTLLSMKANIVCAYILKEDEHETERVSPQILALCNSRGIPCVLVKSIKDHVNDIKKSKPELIVVCGWRTMIPSDIVNLPLRGCIALHESLLPKYRGFAPINWAVINGEQKTGVTLFRLNEQVDDGPIIGQRTILIGSDDTTYEVYKKTIAASIELIKKYHNNILKGQIHTRGQNYKMATYTCARIPEDGKIDWTKTAQEIHNLIRGLALPYPGAFCLYKGTRFVVQKSVIPRQRVWSGSIPGRIVKVHAQEGVEVLTGDGSIIISRVAIDSKEFPAQTYFTSVKGTLQ